MLTWRHSTMTGPGVSAAAEAGSMSSRSPSRLRRVERARRSTSAAVARGGRRRRLVESGAESGEHPVDGCEHDLDAVVDAILQQQQRHADGGQTEATFGEVATAAPRG